MPGTAIKIVLGKASQYVLKTILKHHYPGQLLFVLIVNVLKYVNSNRAGKIRMRNNLLHTESMMYPLQLSVFEKLKQ